MTHELDMTSRCPDGVEIITPWPDEWNPKSIAAQDRQADWHRNEVRRHLHYAEMLERAA